MTASAVTAPGGRRVSEWKGSPKPHGSQEGSRALRGLQCPPSHGWGQTWVVVSVPVVTSLTSVGEVTHILCLHQFIIPCSGDSQPKGSHTDTQRAFSMHNRAGCPRLGGGGYLFIMCSMPNLCGHFYSAWPSFGGHSRLGWDK